MQNKNKEALLNEYKGYLFEFLVAKNLKEHFALGLIEKDLSESTLAMLTQQESYIRNEFPNLLEALPLLAKETCTKIIKDLHFAPDEVSLEGKQNSSLASDHFSEADIVVKNGQIKTLLSLKLAKAGLPTNAKSSGVLSFFKKYFHDTKSQEEFNRFIDFHFEEMARDLHQVYDIPFGPNFDEWKSLGLPVLPGELKSEAAKILHGYYEKLADFLLKKISSYKNDKDFYFKLAPLMGFTAPNIKQVICFYKNKYEFEKVEIHEFPKHLDQLNISHAKSTVKMAFSWGEIHLRIKPMNVFTSKAYKVNVALQFRRL